MLPPDPEAAPLVVHCAPVPRLGTEGENAGKVRSCRARVHSYPSWRECPTRRRESLSLHSRLLPVDIFRRVIKRGLHLVCRPQACRVDVSWPSRLR
jgi:hypothetical protein